MNRAERRKLGLAPRLDAHVRIDALTAQVNTLAHHVEALQRAVVLLARKQGELRTESGVIIPSGPSLDKTK